MPGLPAAAAREGLAPLDYMRRYGAFLIESDVDETARAAESTCPRTRGAIPRRGAWTSGGKAVGLEIDGEVVAGFPTPSRTLEFYSRTLEDWGWPEEALPGYIRSHVHRDALDAARGEMLLLPTFRLPTLIHTRSGNAKYLNEISHRNPALDPHRATRSGWGSRPAISSGSPPRSATS